MVVPDVEVWVVEYVALAAARGISLPSGNSTQGQLSRADSVG